MSLIIDLKQHFTAAKIKRRIENAPPVPSTVTDRLFPAEIRQQHESPVIPVSEIVQTVGVVPVVMRGGDPVSLVTESDVNTYIEPLPVKVRADLDPVAFNNLKLSGFGSASVDNWANRKTMAMRKAVKATTEALCAQAAFNGAISFPLQLDNGDFTTYTVSFGGKSILTYNVAAEAKWDHAEASLGKVYKMLTDMSTKLDNAGYGGAKIVHAGALAFGKLLELVEAVGSDKSKVPVRINEDGTVTVGKFKIHEMSETWRDPHSGTTVNKLADKEIRMNAKDATGFFYGPVDDLDAKLQPLPMFVKPVRDEIKGGMAIIGHSKPLPCIAPESVCKATVLA